LLAIPVVFVTVAACNRRWTSDDGFIDVRIVQQIFAGHGPVFNAGERVEAGTSPAWTGLLVLGRILFFGMATEWVAVIFGIAATAGAVVLAEIAGMRLYRTTRVIPLGVLAFVVLPPTWDFATAGLETGICFLWIAGSQLALVAAARAPKRRRTLLIAAIVIGFGPLVRPDYVVISVVYLAALLVVARPYTARRTMKIIGAAVLLPALYEVFRIFYYGALLPNDVAAKDPTRPDWHQGWLYFKDFISPYWLWIPIVFIAVALVVALRSRLHDRINSLLVAAPVVSALLYTVLLVRGGGYHMHGRLLVPAFFALMLPVAVVPRNPTNIALVAFAALWAIVPILAGGPSYTGVGKNRISNERSVWVETGNPVTLNDYRHQPDNPILPGQRGVTIGDRARELAKQHARVLISKDGYVAQTFSPLDNDVRYNVVVAARAIGMVSVAAGPDVYVEDLLGLADPLAAHTPNRDNHWPGHEKLLPMSWVFARFANNANVPPTVASPRDIQAARDALRCSSIGDLWSQPDKPLSLSTLFSNAFHAFSDYGARVPSVPEQAAASCP
jgi:arabinofuranosyltransferase